MSKLLAVAEAREALIRETIKENAQLRARVAELEACNAGLTKLTLKQNRRVAELEEAIRDFAKYLPPEVNERARAVLAHGSAGR